MALILPGNVASATADAGYDVANSCRFDEASSSSLTRATGETTGGTKWTLSTWIKRSTLGSLTDGGTFMGWYTSTSKRSIFGFNDDDKLYWWSYNGSAQGDATTAAAFRDVSAWYHVVLKIDTTQAVLANRVKIYVNSVEQTLTFNSTYPTQNEANTGMYGSSYIGSSFYNTATDRHFGGYLAETVMIDDAALAPTSFGEANEDSPKIWQPIDVSELTFGTDGFYLDFEDSGTLGNDISDVGDFTAANLAATDQTTDTCTNNFATLNPLDNYLAGATLSEGNTKQVTHAGNETYNTTTIGASSGKWYCEMKHISSSGGSALTTRTMYGIADGPTAQSDSQGTGNVYIFRSDGNQFSGSTESSSWGTAWNSTGEIIGIAMDLDNNKLYFAVNGTWQNSGDPTSGATGTGALAITADKTYFFVAGDLTGSVITNYMNFGNPLYANSSSVADADGYGDFEYAPPSGYYALCTKNLGAYGG